MNARLLAPAALALLAAVARADCPGAPRLEPVAAGLDSPLFVTHAGDGSGRLFIVERSGVIKVLPAGGGAPSVFLDISGPVASGGERGLLGLAFHPSYTSNGRFFVYYTETVSGDKRTAVAEYHVSADPDVAAPTETRLMTMDQPFTNHNGGMLAFGPDGYLYVGKGDGGDAHDPGNHAQDVEDLLGKILRIDVDHAEGGLPYASPPSNPFFGPGPGRDEVCALGMRNPWRFSFDRATGELYVADVGQGNREEIDIVTLGGNYGWRVMEGTRCNVPDDPLPCGHPGFVPPIHEYQHTDGRCSVTGGYVYRGPDPLLPGGAYLFGDFCTGEIFLLRDGVQTVLLDTELNISSFGEDEAGHVYVVDIAGGSVQRLLGGTRLEPASAVFGAAGGTGQVVLSALASCDWTAVPSDPWIQVTSASSGTGSATIDYAVDVNEGGVRYGSLAVAGRASTVAQAGSTPPVVSIGDASVVEGDSGTRVMTFTVSLSEAAVTSVSVQYATAHGTATGSDYTAKALTTLVFAAGETSRTVPITVRADTKDEDDETFAVNLSSPAGVTLGDGQGAGTILDDDPEPTLSIAGWTGPEGSTSQTISLQVTLSTASGRTVAVSYGTVAGTAEADSDFVAKTNALLTFNPGQTTKDATVQVIGDFVPEATESFLVRLHSAAAAGIASPDGSVTITDDDAGGPVITVAVSDAAPVTEGNTGTRNAVFTVSLSQAGTQSITASYATAAQTATSGDFTSRSGTVTFAPGQTQKTVTVPVKGDLRDEPDETFLLTLTGAAGATAGGPGTGTIVDDDPLPSVSVGDAAPIVEGNSGTRNMGFKVTLSAASGFTVAVSYASVSGSADAADYTHVSGTLTFSPGQATRTVNVPIKGDPSPEPDETVHLDIDDPVNAVLGDAQGTGTILTDDP